MDRRVKKSRQALFEAFMTLSATHAMDKLSVAMITDQADVNRGTFYLHFKDKFDLRKQCVDMHLQQLMTGCSNGSVEGVFTAKQAMRSTFNYLKEHAAFYRDMFSGEDTLFFRKRMEEMLREGFQEADEIKKIKDELDREILIQAQISASAGLIEWWLFHEDTLPIDDVLERFIRLLPFYK
ncbi:TetR/AcrR family transcriptional regulator [Neptunitalea lumnitzerae]|uniref:TetR family transcriptional regulator n=1 Tax=Neptunitalea lumnitzerae TaxID=2965509 RepID=A0ABQ5MJ18_9FLAO|nr:TetR/AcrR family transcriptional regulator [Neptunitalea sp. Y10]GLB49410.1 TetR family transcriptional regulator [Neptunitalea sp. Y10]